MSESLVEKLSRRECITVNEDDNLNSVISNLAKNKIGALPVINLKNRIVGIVSERDIIKLLSSQSNKEIFSKKIKYIMTKNVITCDINMRSDELMMIMSKNKIRHIPIKKNDKLLGMVSIGDVVSRLVEKYQKEAELLREFISM
tara:strand:- start:822 stop:1253 length:432 start_codon:yes stop_codon:yes gene_type:complete